MKRLSPEHDLQVAVIGALGYCLAPDALFFSVPNERKASVANAGRLKAAGLLPGVSDLIVTWRAQDGAARVVAIELKAPKGRVTPAQKDFLRRAQSAGWAALVCRSVAEVLEALEALQAPLRRVWREGRIEAAGR